MLSLLSVLQPLLMAREGARETERERMTLLRFRDLDSLIPFLCISQPDGRMDVWVNKWMDGLSLGGGKVVQDGGRWCFRWRRRRGETLIWERAGQHVALSLCQTLSQDTHICTHMDTRALPSSTLFVRAAAPRQVRNS